MFLKPHFCGLLAGLLGKITGRFNEVLANIFIFELPALRIALDLVVTKLRPVCFR